MIHAPVLTLCALFLQPPGSPVVRDRDVTPEALGPAVLARQIDKTLAETWQAEDVRPTEAADDATFLRRLSLDLLGTIPTRQEVDEFLHDEDPDRRTAKVREYLDDPAFAQNLSILWAGVLLEDADPRPEGTLLRPWLEEAFAAGTPFADVVRELVAGTGSSEENGALGYLLSYRRTPENLTSVTARAFLGLQVQCAQCHDHPYDDWTQDQFNAMTAFFTGVRASQNEVPGQRRPEYTVTDLPRDERREDGFRRLLGLIRRAQGEAEEEMEASPPMGGMGMGDSPRARRRAMRRARRDPEAARKMYEALLAELPPEAQQRIHDARERIEKYGEPTTLDGQRYDPAQGSSPRRMLAEWIVAPDNPYFARAVVNRFWAHLFGKGLTEPMDDLSAGEDVVLPQLLDFLALQFQRSDTDLRHLVEALVLTDAYALQAADEKDPAGLLRRERLFAAHPVRPLDPDQVQAALVRATASQRLMERRGRGVPLEVVRRKVMEQFEYTFGDEEGSDGGRFEAGIPQALYMMNSRMTNDAIRLRACDLLQEILADTNSEKEQLRQMFYATLGREPTRQEAGRLLRLVRDARGSRGTGLEDLYWALLNSSEFLTNH